MVSTLHYFYDPLCGWCYGAAPLVQAAAEQVQVQAHGGGLMAGAARKPVTEALRAFVVGHDQRIASVSGQTFGPGYTDGLLRDHGAVLDSSPPITAILAADAVGGGGSSLQMLKRLQQAHYVEGRRIADDAVIASVAAELGLDATAFGNAFDRLRGPATEAHIQHSRALMARLGARGFPSFALEQDGQFTLLDAGPYLGQPERWSARLSGLLQIEGRHAGA